MFHPYNISSSYLRSAIFFAHKGKCAYCGRTMQQRDMHVDHIIPSHMRECNDEGVKQYLSELQNMGFDVDSIENYLPSCSACNIMKSNRVFCASNLRFFHEEAGKHVDDILKRIATMENEKEEVFYEPIDTELWESLDFSHQHNISYAIAGYRLTPADVQACPRFPQVDRIEKQLKIVDYVVLQGEPGCGKSISAYQSAYDFYKKGWKVYRYKATEKLNVPTISCNTEPSLYVLDDAQLLSEKTIEAIVEQARPNAKIIVARTTQATMRYDAILLTNADAVKILHDDFLKRKDEIIPIVHDCDRRIGINFLDSPIEHRLMEAGKATTPWQFNYILRGGWQTMKEQYQTICVYHDCDLLAAAISVFQIVQFDNQISFRRLCDSLQYFDSSLVWDDRDLQYLVDQKIVLSLNDVRIVHIESAKVIIARFLKSASTEKKKILYKVIERSFLQKEINPLGLVWLCDGLIGYIFPRFYENTFISDKMINSAFEFLKDVKIGRERVSIALFMEEVFTAQYEKNGRWYFDKHESELLDWITHADSETAYAYSDLINTLINTDKKRYRQFAKKIDWVQIISSLKQERNPNLYAWGRLINRLTCFLPRAEHARIGEMLCPVLVEIRSKTGVSNIAALSYFLCHIAHLSPIYVHETARVLAPVYREFFAKDMEHAMQIFDFKFFLYLCGMSLLGRYRTTKEERKTAVTIVEALPVAEFAAIISNSLPRDWQSIHEIMLLVGLHNKEKANEIVNAVDVVRLSEMAKDSWNQRREINHIYIALHIGDGEVARRFIEYNEDRIQAIEPSLALIAPQCTIRVFRSGLPVQLLSTHRWEISFYALRELMKTDAVAAKEILSSNSSTIIKNLNSCSAMDFEDDGCLAFLQLVRLYDESIYQNVVSALDIRAIISCLEKSHITPRKKKRVEQKHREFLDSIMQ